MLCLTMTPLFPMRIACGMKLRGDDPVRMKDFIQSVQQRVNELKSSSGDGQGTMTGKRVLFCANFSRVIAIYCASLLQ